VLFELCRFRNHHPAFNGTFELLDTIPDIKESTVLLPPTAFTPSAPAPLPGAVTPITSTDAMTEGPPGASGSFAAQTVSLLASLDGEDSDFLADIVLERSSIDVLASVDPGDGYETEWYVFFAVNLKLLHWHMFVARISSSRVTTRMTLCLCSLLRHRQNHATALVAC
jgi:hypothetical protein